MNRKSTMVVWLILGLLTFLHTIVYAQVAPLTKTVQLVWECNDPNCASVTLFTIYSRIECTGNWNAVTTVPGDLRTVQVTSSTTHNTCWAVTANGDPVAWVESNLSNAARWPITYAGGFPIRLVWTAPVGGTAVSQYIVYKQVACAGNYLPFIAIPAPTVNTLLLPPLSDLDCWKVSAVSADLTEGTATAPYQIPVTIMGESGFIIRGGQD